MTSATSAFPSNVISPPAEIAPVREASPSNEIVSPAEISPLPVAVPLTEISPVAKVTSLKEASPVTEIIPLDESALFTTRFPLMDKLLQFPETFIISEEVSVTEPALIPFSPRITFLAKVPFSIINVLFAIIKSSCTFNICPE